MAPRSTANPAGIRVPPRVPRQRPGRTGGKRDANRRRRTAQLCRAALTLYLERGVNDVPVDDIVARAGVAKGSFYRYFRDQAELVDTILAPLSDTIGTALDRCREALRATESAAELPRAYAELARGFGKAVAGHPNEMRLYLQESRSPGTGARAPIRALADRVTAEAFALSEFAHGSGMLRAVDPRIGALTTIGAVEHLLFEYLSGTDLGPPADVPRTLMSIILDGVRG